MQILRCHLTLMEKTFFSSREISNFYYTEPLIGNYALAYALGLCQAPYYNDGTIHYERDFSRLNAHGIYVTPATIQGEPSFLIEWFNSQPETYWAAMGSGVLVTRPDGARMERRGKAWYAHRPGAKPKMIRPANRPQLGRIRYLATGNEAVFYLLSRDPVRVPSYIRLGKFMSKARVTTETVTYEQVEAHNVRVASLLNPADLDSEADLKLYDLLTVPPTPLIRNAILSGPFYKLVDGTHLPIGMRFGVASN